MPEPFVAGRLPDWHVAGGPLRIRDPHKDEKVAVIRKARDECGAEHPVFYEDEMDINLNPKIVADRATARTAKTRGNTGVK